jgi:NTP pyrophosphatase (non-canonical NTP hydrolase)
MTRITPLQYREFTRETSNEFTEHNRTYLLAGLMSEVGELADLLKKFIATGGADDRWHTQSEILPELGDILWYVTRLADTHGLGLEDLMLYNMEKLRARMQAGTIVTRMGRTP